MSTTSYKAAWKNFTIFRHACEPHAPPSFTTTDPHTEAWATSHCHKIYPSTFPRSPEFVHLNCGLGLDHCISMKVCFDGLVYFHTGSSLGIWFFFFKIPFGILQACYGLAYVSCYAQCYSRDLKIHESRELISFGIFIRSCQILLVPGLSNAFTFFGHYHH